MIITINLKFVCYTAWTYTSITFHVCLKIYKPSFYLYVHIALTLEQAYLSVNEGNGSVQVCMRFGGEALETNAALTVYNGSALSKSLILE